MWKLLCVAAFIAAALVVSSLALTSHSGLRLEPSNLNLAHTGVVAQPTKEIVAAPVIDHDADTFVGTGDASAGSWTRR